MRTQRILTIVVTILCVLLLYGNLQLQRKNDELSRMLTAALQQTQVTLGTTLPPLYGKDTRGSDVVLRYGSGTDRRLLLVLSPDCKACDQNWANWRSLLNDRARRAFTPVVINLGPSLSAEYINRNGLRGMEIIDSVSDVSKVAYRLAGTPSTILVSQQGTVERVRLGVLDGNALSAFRDSLSR